MIQTANANCQAKNFAASIGVSLFSSDLYMPSYKEVQTGRWKLTRTGFCLDRGYYTGLCGVASMPVLMRKSGDNDERWEVWMSLSPHEIESQELGCRHAFGHTVVMGLGMGWVAINIALNTAVHKVTVIERDPEVIDLFRQSQALDGLDSKIINKICIQLADALEWQPDEPVDFLYADIWRCLEEPQTLDDVRRMQANVQAHTIYFWGQELLIHALSAQEPKSCHDRKPEETIRRTVTEKIALPLLLPEKMDYPEFIAKVARERRRLSQDIRITPAEITLRPITDDDLEFLFQLYSSTRAQEKELGSWNHDQWQEFLRMQFNLQHTQYMQNYDNPSFDIVLLGGIPVGRLYVNKLPDEIRIIDISLLPIHRSRGIGACLLENVLAEGDGKGVPVTLHVERINPAWALYRRLGFQEVSSDGVFCFMKCPPGTN